MTNSILVRVGGSGGVGPISSSSSRSSSNNRFVPNAAAALSLSASCYHKGVQHVVEADARALSRTAGGGPLNKNLSVFT